MADHDVVQTRPSPEAVIKDHSVHCHDRDANRYISWCKRYRPIDAPGQEAVSVGIKGRK